jgi:hypothetical protein
VARSFIGFVESSKEDGAFGMVLMLPHSTDEKGFITDLLTQALPSMSAHHFPELINARWLDEEPYVVQSQLKLEKERHQLEKEHQARLQEIEERIEREKAKYRFLYDILAPTATDSELVNAVEVFLKKVGYGEIGQPAKQHVLEEDLQIRDGGSLIVVEVKGLSGFPTERDCGQVHKYVTRRGKLEKRTDVHGLFVVNHERNLAPLERQNPPFTQQQINDAEYSEVYSLVTTWQLFNAFLACERGELTFEDIDACLHKPGLITFRPRNWRLAGRITHVYDKIGVGRVELGNGTVTVGSTLGVINKGKFLTQKVDSIQVDREEVSVGYPGQNLGIKFAFTIRTNLEVYFID